MLDSSLVCVLLSEPVWKMLNRVQPEVEDIIIADFRYINIEDAIQAGCAGSQQSKWTFYGVWFDNFENHIIVCVCLIECETL